MKRCALAGLASAWSLWIACAPRLILSSAEASAAGSPQISAPTRSASYSRPRLIAICTRPATSGARIAAAMPRMAPTGLGRPLLSRAPAPNIMPKLAIMPMAPASVAVIVMISESRLRTWASSCAITAATSRSSSMRRRPVVAATAAFSGLRPVAKALGWSFSMMKTRGIGMDARAARPATMAWKRGASCGPISRAPYMRSTIRSENQ